MDSGRVSPWERLVTGQLVLRRLVEGDLDDFHTLVVDQHVRRYLMDGEHHGRSFSEAALGVSHGLFSRLGVGLYLVDELAGQRAIGFSGIYVIEEQSPEPQLIYAFYERVTGRGYATQAARGVLQAARAAGLMPLLAGADTPNVASLRVLEKLGFEETHREPGAFGETIMGRIP